MDRVEEGVANFREFQNDARKFFTRADTRDEERKIHQDTRDKELKAAVDLHTAKQNKWFALLGLIVATMALLIGWLTYRDSQRKVGDNHPVTQSQSLTPQNAGNESRNP
jgi:hypothetical protein